MSTISSISSISSGCCSTESDLRLNIEQKNVVLKKYKSKINSLQSKKYKQRKIHLKAKYYELQERRDTRLGTLKNKMQLNEGGGLFVKTSQNDQVEKVPEPELSQKVDKVPVSKGESSKQLDEVAVAKAESSSQAVSTKLSHPITSTALNENQVPRECNILTPKQTENSDTASTKENQKKNEKRQEKSADATTAGGENFDNSTTGAFDSLSKCIQTFLDIDSDYNFMKPKSGMTEVEVAAQVALLDETLVKLSLKVHEGKHLLQPPMVTWDDMSASGPEMDKMSKFIQKTRNWVAPRPIQVFCWGVILSGVSIVGVAPTGSGKTMAFMIPAIVHSLKMRETLPARGAFESDARPNVLVIGPTRELVIQINDESIAIANEMGLNTALCYGGRSKTEQLEQLADDPAIVIGVPGRLQDFLQSRSVVTDRTTMLILDEADRMLDAGFRKDILFVSNQITKNRQLLLFSATWNDKKVNELSKALLAPDADFIHIGTTTEKSLCESVRHRWVIVNSHKEKISCASYLISQKGSCPAPLADLISETALRKEGLIDLLPKSKSIVFVNGRREIETVVYKLKQEGIITKGMSGDKDQADREAMLNSLRDQSEDSLKTLVATDVVARGIDVVVHLVIQLGAPNNLDNYIHRSGRTGRRGGAGLSVVIMDRTDLRDFGPQLLDYLRSSFPQQNLSDLERGIAASNSSK